jgi:malate synthase
LQCDRNDYLFSLIRLFHRRAEFVLPDQATILPSSHFLQSLARLLAGTARRRQVRAGLGVATETPLTNDAEDTTYALSRVRADMVWALAQGGDRLRVAHPVLALLAIEVYEDHARGIDSRAHSAEAEPVAAADLLQIARGKITERGVRDNIALVLRYLAARRSGVSWLAVGQRMTDAALAELCRAQLWQWLHHATGVLDEGRNVSGALFATLLAEEVEGIVAAEGNDGIYKSLAELLEKTTVQNEFADFITLQADRLAAEAILHTQ